MPGSWANWNGTQTWAGPVQTNEVYGLGDIPLFVNPAFGPLPLKTLASVAAPFPDPLVWAVWPGARGGGNFTLYEDDGASDAYQGGEFALTPAAYSSSNNSSGGGLTLTIGPISVSGALPPGFPGSRGHVVQVGRRRGTSAAPRQVHAPTLTRPQVRGAGGCSVASVSANGAAVPPGDGVPGWYMVSAANHSLATPEGALVVNAGGGFPTDAPVEVAVTWGSGSGCLW